MLGGLSTAEEAFVALAPLEDDLRLVCSFLRPRFGDLFDDPPELLDLLSDPTDLPDDPTDLSHEPKLDDLLWWLPRLRLEERRQLPLPLLPRRVPVDKTFIRATFSSNSSMIF